MFYAPYDNTLEFSVSINNQGAFEYDAVDFG